jgi:hypothetical protein
MKIEVLYVPGCPNYQPTFERIQAVLVSEAVKAGIQGIAVTTEVEAKALSFPGISPCHKTPSSVRELIQTGDCSVAFTTRLAAESTRRRSAIQTH